MAGVWVWLGGMIEGVQSFEEASQGVFTPNRVDLALGGLVDNQVRTVLNNHF